MAAVVAIVITPPAGASAAPPKGLSIEVLSSRPEWVSDGDALVRVTGARDTITVTLNGDPISLPAAPDGSLTGLVSGLRPGPNELRASARHKHSVRVVLVNHPRSGPIFSGPQQYPFLCRTAAAGLGQPIVDNQQQQGFRVLDSTGALVGWSRDCTAPTVVDLVYRATNGTFKPMPADGSRPADLTSTTTLDGQTVDYIVRRERGTINRFVYSIAMLADESAWNKRVIYRFDGGVAIGHDQGTLPGGHLYHDGLSLGYAVLYSTGTRTNTHYNLVLGGETALMLKEHFIEEHAVPLYTVGVGGSGGAIQQYLYGQNHPGLLDAAIPEFSYPDMVTQTIHVGDCELLERYMDVTDVANPKWKSWEDREWLIGLNGSAARASDECVNGWRGLTPLALNPLFGTAGAGTERMDPAVMAKVHWTHWEDVKNVYGVGPDGYALQTWDNVGVQYGLKALTDGHITPAEFLDLNAKVGSWKDPGDMVQEGRPFLPVGEFDPWSLRNQQLDERREGSIAAMNAAYREGLYFHGDIDIPVIDWRPYREEILDMHNSHQSFASRQRMRDWDGKASNQVIWFSEIGDDRSLEALSVIDTWVLSGHRPAEATDRCFTANGTEIARGAHVWDGILDTRSPGACTEHFPLHSTSRIVAGGPLRGGVYKCALQPVAKAIARGLYGSWKPTAAERVRLEQIFPTGVCDYTKPDQGLPKVGHRR